MLDKLTLYFNKPKKEIIDDAFVLVSALTIVSLPFSKRLNSIMIVALILCWLIQNNYKRLLQILKTNKLFWLNISLYLLSLISLLYTQNRHDGKFELEKEFSLLLFPFLLASTKHISRKKIDFILWLFILANFTIGITGIVYAIFSYFQYHVNYFFYHDLVMLFHFHATYFSMYILFSIAALLYLFSSNINEYNNKIKAIIILIIAFFIVLIFLLSIRSIIIFFAVSVLIGITVYTIKNKKFKLGFSLLIGFVVVIYVGINNNAVLKSRLIQIVENHKYEFSELNIYNGFTTRLAQWESSLNIIKKQPLLGVGIGDVQDELQIEYKKNLLFYSYRDRFNAHNQYFQTSLGLGIIGLMLFVACFLFPAILAFRQKNYLYLAFIILFSSCCITESMLCMQHGVVFFAFFNSLFTFHTLKNEIYLKPNVLTPGP